MGKKFNCKIIAKSTFSDKGETRICKEIETSEVKSLVKNENLIVIEMQKKGEIEKQEIYEIYQSLLENNIIVEAYQKQENGIQFRILKSEQTKVQEILENKYIKYQIKQRDITKLSIVGYGIIQDNKVLNEVMKVLKRYGIAIIDISLTQSKVEIIADNIDNNIIQELHEKLIK